MTYEKSKSNYYQVRRIVWPTKNSIENDHNHFLKQKFTFNEEIEYEFGQHLSSNVFSTTRRSILNFVHLHFGLYTHNEIAQVCSLFNVCCLLSDVQLKLIEHRKKNSGKRKTKLLRIFNHLKIEMTYVDSFDKSKWIDTPIYRSFKIVMPIFKLNFKTCLNIFGCACICCSCLKFLQKIVISEKHIDVFI
jgi:hypothetical protein